MPTDLRTVKTFPQLLRYLRDELLWPIESDDAEELSFEYAPADFAALAPEHHVQIDKILQLRPLVTGQPWGIFYVQFKKARLPVVVLRELLASLVFKKRASANKSERPAWECHDLLFISSYGDDGDQRHLNFAHFSDSPNGSHLPALRVLDWDEDDTDRALQRLDGTLHERLRWPEDDTNLAKWREQWSAAFSRGLHHPIRKAEQLAYALATLAKNIRSSVLAQMAVESERGKLRMLHAAFRSALIHDLEAKQFADMFAQTVSYGLFTNATRRTVAGGGTAITADGAVDSITSLSPFLRDLLDEFLSVSGRRRGGLDYDKLGVNEVVDLLNAESTDLSAVLDDFGHTRRDEDPVIHFYETFLAAYDKDEKIKRGVFYTPRPVVSYIVRSVHELLQNEFKIPHGLAATETWGEIIVKFPHLALPNLSADPKKPRLLSTSEFFVQILDPATGTATFLVETIDVIFRHLKAAWETGSLGAMPEIHNKSSGSSAPKNFAEYWNLYVPTSLLPRLYGYELMMAPYAIAHMKLALKLADTGFSAWGKLGLSDRVNIYLTNALEPKVEQLPQIGFEALAHEAEAVNEIKWDKRFTIIIGNPPYSGVSSNMSETAQRIVDAYKIVDGAALNERKLWIQDDYVKFIRFAQTIVDRTCTGILGFVTNHGYLENPTFRGMRQSIMHSFDQIYLLDLHGNANKKERALDGSADENVFDIRQGVAINLSCRLVKEGAVQTKSRHADQWGLRTSKYLWLTNHSVSDSTWHDLNPNPPHYFFLPRCDTNRKEYEFGVSLKDIFVLMNVGMVTARDALSIHYSQKDVLETVETFSRLSEEEARTNFDLGKDATSWKVRDAQQDVRKNGVDSKLVARVLYRPFDFRYTYYTGKSGGFICRPIYGLMRHMLNGKNISLCFHRREELAVSYSHFLATNRITEHGLLSSKTTNCQAPLYIEPDANDKQHEFGGDIRRPNFNPSFLRLLCAALSLKAEDSFGLPNGILPETIFHYAYAVFHSPGYRSRYAEFLKIDFPRLPLTGNLELFRKLAQLGDELTTLHLLDSPKLDQPLTEFVGGRNPEVEKISWSKNTVWVDKAQSIGFKGVCQEVWNFHVGGYQVCEKWLKDRKGRNLSADDRAHYQKIIVSLSETIRLMTEVDAAIEKHGGWPDAFIITRIDSELAPDAAQTYPHAAPPDLGSKAEDELPLG
jgi:hypothetical protein